MNIAFADSRSFKGEGIQKEKQNLVEFPVWACGKLYSSRRWSRTISGDDTHQRASHISLLKVATQIPSRKFKAKVRKERRHTRNR